MSTLNVGDRVHLKWDHSVTGTVRDSNLTQVAVEPEAGLWIFTPFSWWEPIPEPLKELVPIEVLIEILSMYDREIFTNYRFSKTTLLKELRERGYGKADD
jgi:hypothetical protein